MRHTSVAHDRFHVGEIEIYQRGGDDNIGNAPDSLTQNLVGALERFHHSYVLAEILYQPVVGYDDKRVHVLFQIHYADFGIVHTAFSLEAERFGYDADGKNTHFLRNTCDYGCSARAGASAHTCGNKQQVCSLESLFNGFSAACLPISGLAPAPSPLVSFSPI